MKTPTSHQSSSPNLRVYFGWIKPVFKANLDGQVLVMRLLEAARHAAVLCGIDEGCGAQCVVQQVAR